MSLIHMIRDTLRKVALSRPTNFGSFLTPFLIRSVNAESMVSPQA